jgi:hypothetical protein
MLAESEYRDMLNNNTWTGIHTKGTKPVFQAGGKNSKGHKGTGKGPECWNGCGGCHVVQDCKKPLDQNRITANKKKYFAAIDKKRSSNGGRGRGGHDNGGRGRGGRGKRVQVLNGRDPRVARTIKE